MRGSERFGVGVRDMVRYSAHEEDLVDSERRASRRTRAVGATQAIKKVTEKGKGKGKARASVTGKSGAAKGKAAGKASGKAASKGKGKGKASAVVEAPVVDFSEAQLARAKDAFDSFDTDMTGESPFREGGRVVLAECASEGQRGQIALLLWCVCK